MVPTANHYEQLCNATDAKRAGLAQSDSFFNIDLALQNKNTDGEAQRNFKNWVDTNSDKIINTITSFN